MDKSSTFKEFLKNKKIEQYKKNIEQVCEDIHKTPIPNWLIKKIKNECERKPIFTEEEIIEQIKKNKYVASYFAKDPTRQSIDEKCQIKYLQQKDINIQKLPTTGKKAFYLQNGKLVTNIPKINMTFETTKSIDALIKEKEEYCCLKSAKEKGGSQDNQFRDCKLFIKQADRYCSTHNDNKKFSCIVSDAYFTDKKIKVLKDMISQTNREKISVYRVEDL